MPRKLPYNNAFGSHAIVLLSKLLHKKHTLKVKYILKNILFFKIDKIASLRLLID